MEFFKRLFGSSPPPSSPLPRIARGRGFTFEIVGESRYQDNLDRLAGGKCEEGCNFEVPARLLLEDDNPHDRDAVAVTIQGRAVGYMPKEEAAQFRAALERLSPGAKAANCDGKIVGGWLRDDGDEGHYGVKLSISNPLRLR